MSETRPMQPKYLREVYIPQFFLFVHERYGTNAKCLSVLSSFRYLVLFISCVCEYHFRRRTEIPLRERLTRGSDY